MRKKNTLLLRILCAMLTLCLAATIAAPTASALTVQEERSLQTGQRSLNNPNGSFELPKAMPGWRLFHPDTLNAGQLIARNILKQLFLGIGEADAVERIFAHAPIVKESDKLPPVAELETAALLASVLNGMSLYAVLQETVEPNVYRVIGICTNSEGEAYTLSSGLLYNPVTGKLWEVNNTGIMGLGFDYDLRQQMLITASEAWIGVPGFNIFFDMLAPLILEFFDTVRFPFEYNGLDWQIQFWKGYYILGNGAEIGIYNKDPGVPIFYQKSDAYLDMTMQLFQKDGLYFDYGPQRTWWTGGFSHAKPFWQQTFPKQLRLTGTILFEDPGMLEAFLVSFEANRPENMTGGAEGLLFRFDWIPSK